MLLKTKNLRFYFQPKFNINANKFNGAEALVRWQKPDGTIISPGSLYRCLKRTAILLSLTNMYLKKLVPK